MTAERSDDSGVVADPPRAQAHLLGRVKAGAGRLRPVVLVLIALQILIPLVMLAIRWDEPERGQMPFGWQMHTTCWGMEDERCR